MLGPIQSNPVHLSAVLNRQSAQVAIFSTPLNTCVMFVESLRTTKNSKGNEMLAVGFIKSDIETTVMAFLYETMSGENSSGMCKHVCRAD